MKSFTTHSRSALHFAAVLLVVFIQFNLSKPQDVQAAPAPEPVRPRPLSAPGAAVTLNVPTNVILGQDVSFSVTFRNTGADPGYGPFIDLLIPATGADGAAACPAASPFDGLGTTSITATYLGAAIPPTDFFVTSFDCSGHATHPLAKDGSGNLIAVPDAPITPDPSFLPKPGDKLVTIRLPFGSFTPGQPAATVNVTVNMSNLADVGTPLNIQARGGFQFGSTPLDDWCCDSVVNTITSWTSAPVTPILYTISKTYNGPEDETATGPNFPRSYTVTVDIADQQNLTNLVVTDLLPNNIQFISASSIPAFNSSSLPSTTIPGGTLALTYNSITGNTTTTDITITVNFFVPQLNSVGGDVVNPLSGAAGTSTNSATAQGDWLPFDVRDRGTPNPPGTIPEGSVCGTPCTPTINDRSIAIQKGVSGVPAPKQTQLYTLNFQVSDFFAFNNIIITDVVSDGQHVDPTYTPQLAINGNPNNWPATDMLSTPLTDATNWTYDIACNYTGTAGSECTTDNTGAPNDGTTTVTFRVSQEIRQRLLDATGRMIGGCVLPAGGRVTPCDRTHLGDGPTTGTITFRTIIQQNYTDIFPSGDPSVDQGDIVNDNVTVSGDVLDTSTFVSTGTATDVSAATINIPTGTLTKEIYQVNGAAPGSPVLIKPGDNVTYRITYHLPTGDEENLSFADYLPLPIFSVSDPDGNGTAGPAWSFNPVVSGTSPPAGTAKFGPSDTFYNYICNVGGTPPPATMCGEPTVAPDVPNNRLSFSYGPAFNGPNEGPYTVDLLFTVTVSALPFADKLYLTNEVRGTEGSTQLNSITADSIVQLILTEPVLVHKKGVVATDNPNATFAPTTVGPVAFNAPGTPGARWSGLIDSAGLAANPIDSNIRGVDAGDLVTFAIVIENQGSSAKGAFDITILDTLPSIYQVPAGGMNLQIMNGDRSSTFTYHQADGTTVAVPTDIFSTGIRIDDPDPLNGACQASTVGAGKNIIIITYDLQVVGTATTGVYENTATLTRYSGTDNGPNFVPATPPVDKASSTILGAISKSLANTEIENAVNTRPQVVIGELATYQIVIDIPEGIVPGAQIVDTLDSGLAFVSCLSVVRSSTDITTTYGAGNFSDVCTPGSPSTNPLFTNTGHTATWTLGDITNTNRNNAVAETLTIQYSVVPLNVPGNQSATVLGNSAVFSWAGSPGGQTTAARATVTVIESNVNIAKTVTPATGDAGDPITYKITLSGATTTDAFDATLEDTIPALIDSPTLFSVTDTAGIVTASNFNLTATPPFNLTTLIPFNMPVSATRQIVLTITGTISYSVSPSQAIPNTALVRWTSLNGDYTTPNITPGHLVPRSTYNSASVERTGAGGVGGGGTPNDYAKNATATFTVNTGSLTKLILATSEGDTPDTPSPAKVAIGEIVRYRTEIAVPEGTSPGVQIRDLLPAGLLFLNDGSAKVALVSAAVGNCSLFPEMTSSTLGTSPDPWVCGDQTNVGTITPTVPVPPGALNNGGTANPFGNGDDPWFNLGTITNHDSDNGNSEFVVLEYNALVMNVPGNVDGTPLNNLYQEWLNGVLNSTSSTASVNVVESHITLTKTNSAISAVDAGDTITYTITIANNSASSHAPAYDSHFTDTLPAGLTLIPGLSSTSALTNNNLSGAGNLVDFTIASIPAGSQAVVTYQATVNITVTPNQAITNTGSLTTTSLPGPKGTSPNATTSTVPGNSGDTNGERIYTNTATSTIHVAGVSITKQITKTSDTDTTGNNVTIGEVITYGIKYTVPEGTVGADTIMDHLPAGLALVPGSSQIITSAAASSGLLTADFNGTIGPASSIAEVTTPGGSVTFSFININTAADNITTNNTILLQYQAIVLNVAGNVGFPLATPTTLTNNATETLGGGSGSVTATVVESKLTITKSASDYHPAQGEILTFTLTIKNDGTLSKAGAFDLVVTDALPASDLTLDLSSIAISAPGATGVTNTSSGNTVSATLDTFPLNTTLTITFKATVISPYNPVIHTIINTAAVTWTSLPGTDTNERTGSGSGPNNYTAQSQVSLTEDRNLKKSLTSSTSTIDLTHARIGDILTYQVVVTIPSNSTDIAMVVDNLPSGLAFVDCAATPITAGADITSTRPAFTFNTIGNCAGGTTAGSMPLVENSGNKITFDFGTIHNASLASVEAITITYRAVVLDIASNVNSVTLNNNATWIWGSGSTTLTAGPVTIREAKLEIVKTVDPAIAIRGSMVTFTIKIDHSSSSSAAAYDALMTDGIPSGMSLVQTSIVVTPSAGLTAVPVITTSATQFSVYWAVFPLGENATITFTATYDGPGAVVNAANTQWSSIQIDPGPHMVPRSTFNLLSTERRYSPTNLAVDNYFATSSAEIRGPKGLLTGFAPGQITLLPPQPEDNAYQDLGNLWLEVPRLGLKLSIVGIPLDANGDWDLTWLSDQAGYLDGTAYPTHAGNSVITGHVYMADGSPGPFVNLHTLQYGDQIIVHLNGQSYIFEVRSDKVTSPDDNSGFKHEIYPWLTLITCKDYNASTNTYAHRVVVRAVLMKIEPDTTVNSGSRDR